MKVKHERLFVWFYFPGVLNSGPKEWEPSDIGRRQFLDHQSLGLWPEELDPYFEVLSAGKRMFDWHSSELLSMWKSGEWWGHHLLWLDWEGDRWILPHLLKWWKGVTGRDLPPWIGQEVSEDVVINHTRVQMGLRNYGYLIQDSR